MQEAISLLLFISIQFNDLVATLTNCSFPFAINVEGSKIKRIKKIAILIIDVDWYEPTYFALKNLHFERKQAVDAIPANELRIRAKRIEIDRLLASDDEVEQMKDQLDSDDELKKQMELQGMGLGPGVTQAAALSASNKAKSQSKTETKPETK